MPLIEMFVRASLATLLVASLATCGRCGGDEGGGKPAASASSSPAPRRLLSCDRITSAGVCSEYTGSHLAQNEAVLSASCTKLAGTFVYAECPNTSVLGTCTLATGETRKFFASGAIAYDVTRAKRECDSFKGKWAAFGSP